MALLGLIHIPQTCFHSMLRQRSDKALGGFPISFDSLRRGRGNDGTHSFRLLQEAAPGGDVVRFVVGVAGEGLAGVVVPGGGTEQLAVVGDGL